MKPTDFATELTFFLTSYLPSQRNASPNTVKSYRDTFMLLIRHCGEKAARLPEHITLHHLDVPLLLEFLQGVEDDHGCGVATRNSRLAAIHSFFRFLQPRRPECLLQCQQIMAIPLKRYTKPPARYFSVEEVKLLLAQPGLQTRRGLRDTTLLALLYDTGARVQEVADLHPADIRMGDANQVKLTGKGRKQRVVPLLGPTIRLLTNYLSSARPGMDPDQPLFFNRTRTCLTRRGIGLILAKYAALAARTDPCFPARVTPHMLRHSKAMHMLHAGTPLPIIQAVLGHADIRTTTRYARASLKQMQEALEKTPSVTGEQGASSAPWQRDYDLINTLKAL